MIATSQDDSLVERTQWAEAFKHESSSHANKQKEK
jgi:hypothetical protein